MKTILTKMEIQDAFNVSLDSELIIEGYAELVNVTPSLGVNQNAPANPAYSVTPINTVKGIKDSFDWMNDWITVKHCPLKPVADEPKIIELIKLTPGLSTEASLKEIDELGFEPAPSNYVLGLGVQHPDAQREHKYVVSLDKQNLFPDEDGGQCFLCLSWYGKRYLDMAAEAFDWADGWWFAVVRKQPLVKAANTDEQFGPALSDFEITVPIDYRHDTQIDTSGAKARNEKTTYFYNDALISQNFAKATNKLVPGKTYKVKIFPILRTVTSEDCIAFLKKQNAVLVGGQGATLVYDLAKDKLPKGKWTISFDEKVSLFEDACGDHFVPYIDAHTDGNFEFGLVGFWWDWTSNFCLLCFCDLSA